MLDCFYLRSVSFNDDFGRLLFADLKSDWYVLRGGRACWQSSPHSGISAAEASDDDAVSAAVDVCGGDVCCGGGNINGW